MPATKKKAAKAPAKAKGRNGANSSIKKAPLRELGYHDTPSWTTQFDNDNTSANVFYCNDVDSGTADYQRIGRVIEAKSLQLHGVAYNNAGASTNKCCIMVIWDTKPKGAKPTMMDILVAANSMSFPNVNNTERFTVLKRMDFTLCGAPGAATITTTSFKTIDFYIDLKGRRVVYGSTGLGTIGDIEEGALYIVTTGLNPGGTTAAGFNYGTRFRFYDA